MSIGEKQKFFDSLTVEEGPCPTVQLSDNKVTRGMLKNEKKDHHEDAKSQSHSL
jgi:hypothetical protein